MSVTVIVTAATLLFTAAPARATDIVQVPVLKQSLPAGTVIAAQHVRMQSIESDYLTDDAVRDRRQLVGKALFQPVVAGEVILARRLAPPVKISPHAPEMQAVELVGADLGAAMGVWDEVDVIVVPAFGACLLTTLPLARDRVGTLVGLGSADARARIEALPPASRDTLTWVGRPSGTKAPPLPPCDTASGGRR